MFFNIQIDLIILKTYDQQFTLTTQKSLHIIFNVLCTLLIYQLELVRGKHSLTYTLNT